MTGRVLGGAALVLHFAVVAFIGYGMQLPTQPPIKPPEVRDGPQCTKIYPRGVKPVIITNKRPQCRNGELGATWRSCQLQYRA